MSDRAGLVRPVLQWVGDNIVTLRDRNLLDNLEKPALILLGEIRETFLTCYSQNVTEGHNTLEPSEKYLIKSEKLEKMKF